MTLIEFLIGAINPNPCLPKESLLVLGIPSAVSQTRSSVKSCLCFHIGSVQTVEESSPPCRQPRFERRNWRSPWLLCIRGHNARSLNQLFNHQKIFSQLCSHRHDTTRVDTWIRTALERFLELHLESACLHGMKTESFTSNTLVKLTLSNGFFFYFWSSSS